jgi:hypothetical protein
MHVGEDAFGTFVWELALQMVAHHPCCKCFHPVTLDKYHRVYYQDNLPPSLRSLFLPKSLIVVLEASSRSFILVLCEYFP